MSNTKYASIVDDKLKECKLEHWWGFKLYKAEALGKYLNCHVDFTKNLQRSAYAEVPCEVNQRRFFKIHKQ